MYRVPAQSSPQPQPIYSAPLSFAQPQQAGYAIPGYQIQQVSTAAQPRLYLPQVPQQVPGQLTYIQQQQVASQLFSYPPQAQYSMQPFVPQGAMLLPTFYPAQPLQPTPAQFGYYVAQPQFLQQARPDQTVAAAQTVQAAPDSRPYNLNSPYRLTSIFSPAAPLPSLPRRPSSRLLVREEPTTETYDYSAAAAAAVTTETAAAAPAAAPTATSDAAPTPVFSPDSEKLDRFKHFKPFNRWVMLVLNLAKMKWGPNLSLKTEALQIECTKADHDEKRLFAELTSLGFSPQISGRTITLPAQNSTKFFDHCVSHLKENADQLKEQFNQILEVAQIHTAKSTIIHKEKGLPVLCIKIPATEEIENFLYSIISMKGTENLRLIKTSQDDSHIFLYGWRHLSKPAFTELLELAHTYKTENEKSADQAVPQSDVAGAAETTKVKPISPPSLVPTQGTADSGERLIPLRNRHSSGPARQFLSWTLQAKNFKGNQEAYDHFYNLATNSPAIVGARGQQGIKITRQEGVKIKSLSKIFGDMRVYLKKETKPETGETLYVTDRVKFKH
ncbi:MAG: hypothetical protein K0S08_1885 [Gammaproteobacteria bacterium]|jgi:hypothetical protein|nr:hypothetical protein [Gammaproteobacteria bacterium]